MKVRFKTSANFVDDDGQGEVIAVQAKENRDEMVVALKRRIRERNIYGLVHIVEGWTYFRQGERDHTMRQILEGEIKVSELRPDDRGEALVNSQHSGPTPNDGLHKPQFKRLPRVFILFAVLIFLFGCSCKCLLS